MTKNEMLKLVKETEAIDDITGSVVSTDELVGDTGAVEKLICISFVTDNGVAYKFKVSEDCGASLIGSLDRAVGHRRRAIGF